MTEAKATRSPVRWTHDLERAFILGIGAHLDPTYCDQSLERTERHLLGYLDSIDTRTDWPKGTRIEQLREVCRNRIKRVRKAMREAGDAA